MNSKFVSGLTLIKNENSNSYLVKKELAEMKNLLNEVIRDLKSTDT